MENMSQSEYVTLTKNELKKHSEEQKYQLEEGQNVHKHGNVST